MSRESARPDSLQVIPTGYQAPENAKDRVQSREASDRSRAQQNPGRGYRVIGISCVSSRGRAGLLGVPQRHIRLRLLELEARM